jgi:hypothetical protein
LLQRKVPVAHFIINLGGFAGLIAGLLALYMGVGQVINEIYGSRVLPV